MANRGCARAWCVGFVGGACSGGVRPGQAALARPQEPHPAHPHKVRPQTAIGRAPAPRHVPGVYDVFVGDLSVCGWLVVDVATGPGSRAPCRRTSRPTSWVRTHGRPPPPTTMLLEPQMTGSARGSRQAGGCNKRPMLSVCVCSPWLEPHGGEHPGRGAGHGGAAGPGGHVHGGGHDAGGLHHPQIRDQEVRDYPPTSMTPAPPPTNACLFTPSLATCPLPACLSVFVVSGSGSSAPSTSRSWPTRALPPTLPPPRPRSPPPPREAASPPRRRRGRRHHRHRPPSSRPCCLAMTCTEPSDRRSPTRR